MALHPQEKGKPTPCKTVRRRSRMSEALPGGLPTMAEEPSARRVYAQLCSGNPSGSQDMETAASHSSDEECSLVGGLTMLTTVLMKTLTGRLWCPCGHHIARGWLLYG